MINPRLPRLCDLLINKTISNLNYTQVRTSVYNRYKHGPTKISNPEPTHEDYFRWIKEAFSRKGLETLKDGFKRVYRNRIRMDFMKTYDLYKVHIFEHFDSDEFLRKWKVGSDSDSLHGFSYGELTRSPGGHALFKGMLDNRIPDDGLTANSGFVALMGPSAPLTKFFHIETEWCWDDFNTFEIRFRGDGRRYNIVLNTATYLSDINYYDNYTYPLYTRGGPYWQTVKIPFSKFIFTVKNHAQDEQGSLPTFKVKFIAINIHDKIDGPFALEIDYMGLRMDRYGIEYDIPYEHYSVPHIKFKQLSLGCDPPESS